MSILVPMTESEYNEFASQTVPEYAAEKIASGEWSPEEALDLAREAFCELLPEGLNTKDNHLFAIRETPGTPALGVLWYAVQERGGKSIAYIYEIHIKPEHRQKGYATAALLALESDVSRLGFAGIALHVFGNNHAAQSLYRKLGYMPSNITMFKPLESTSS
jgi:ribosomal protein S18 acetylase RimI-like enzyme